MPSKKSSKAESALDFLKAGVGALSLQEARRLLEESKNAMNAMKEAQEKARRDVIRAKVELAQTENAQKGKDAYSEQNFWDKRYTEEGGSSSSSSSAGTGTKTGTSGTETYEWYLTYEQMRPLLIEDLTRSKALRLASEGEGGSVREQSGGKGILLAGVGNSTTCEDLWKDKYRCIAGMDYSAGVVQMMQHRADFSGMSDIRYFHADARNVAEESSASYCAIIDKGTLDAICSAGAQGTSDAAAYLFEMWRLLTIDGTGCLVIVTTQPLAILKSFLALVPEGKSAALPWKIERHRSMKTPEGTDVFYYTLIKPMGVAAKASTGGKVTDLAAEMAAVLEEARVAAADAAKARDQLDSRQAAVRSALDALDESKKQRDILAKKLEKSSSELTNMTEDDIRATKSEILGTEERKNSKSEKKKDESVSIDLPTDSPSSDIKVKVIPKVELDVDEDASTLLSGGRVDVKFTLSDGDWDEDDEVCLFLVSSPSDRRGAAGELCDEVETYERAPEPTAPAPAPPNGETQAGPWAPPPAPTHDSSSSDATGDKLVGHCSVKVPLVGGWYRLTYVRVIMTIIPTGDGKVAVNRERNVLASTRAFSIPSKVFGYSSEATSRGCTRRRGPLGPRALAERIGLMAVADDMQSIKTLVVTAIPRPQSALAKGGSRCITRVMTWLDGPLSVTSDGDSAHDNATATATATSATYRLTIETDVLELPEDSSASGSGSGSGSVKSLLDPNTAATKRLEYAIVDLSVAEGIVFDLSAAQAEVAGKMEMGSGGQRVVVRLPYHPSSPSSSSSSSSSSTTALQCNRADLSGLPLDEKGGGGGPVLHCLFCCAAMLNPSAVTSVKALPSGDFDHIMHELVCCEDPTLPLSSSLLEPTRGEMLGNNMYASVHIKDTISGALSLYCKTGPSVLDIATNMPLVGASVAHNRMHGHAHKAPPLVDMSTCGVRCSRCDCYLGDGYVCPDTDTDSDAAGAEETETWQVDDLSCVHFAWHRVSASPGGAPIISVERALARLLVRIADAVHTFTLRVVIVGADADVVDSSAANQLYIRLVGRDSTIALPRVPAVGSATAPSSLVADAALALGLPEESGTVGETLRISYAMNSSARGGSGGSYSGLNAKEVQAALEEEEWHELSALLHQRSMWLGASPFVGQRLAFLLR